MVSSILQYSTIDFRFLEANLMQLSKFSDEIIIPICDHFFNGEPEDQALLNESFTIMSKYPKCSVYIFQWEGQKDNTAYYHNLSRAMGTAVAKNEWLLFVDADEIVDDEFGEWFDTVKSTDQMYWLTCYWYFREPTYRATKTESAGLLIKKQYCNWNLNLREERQQLFNATLVNGDRTLILSKNKLPLVHHYSWVRTKEAMLRKVANWGHKHDKSWVELVEEEFARPFNNTDFVHGYSYTITENKFNI